MAGKNWMRVMCGQSPIFALSTQQSRTRSSLSVESVLSIQGLRKQYGRITAVEGLNLEIPRGTIYGILGPNGSGKTTTLGMVLDVINRTGGDYWWFGKPGDAETRKRVGAILEAPLFYPYLSGYNNMRVVAQIKGAALSEIDPLLRMVNLHDRRNDPFKTYSLGMKQRLAIAAAMLRSPEVLILDEPTNGLDPQGIVEIRETIRAIGAQGVTILLASHLLDEVERVCTHVAVLQKGRLRYSGLVSEMKPGQAMIVVQAADMERLAAAMGAMPHFIGATLQEGKLLATFEETPDPATVNLALHAQGIHLSHLTLRKSTLEEQFLELTRIQP
jgi:ABC-2 type transport system ATP-binding protein